MERWAEAQARVILIKKTSDLGACARSVSCVEITAFASVPLFSQLSQRVGCISSSMDSLGRGTE
jgi:hypothetical protein